MNIVCHPEEHPATLQRISSKQPHRPRMKVSQTGKGIIGPPLVNHITYEAEGKWGMNAIASAMSETGYPHPRSTKMTHKGAY